MDRIARAVTTLRAAATSATSASALEGARTSLEEFGEIEKRIRDYITSGAQLMAADVIFTEGGETALDTARQIERARVEEHHSLDAYETALRRQQLLALGGAAALSLLIVAILALTPPHTSTDSAASKGLVNGDELVLRSADRLDLDSREMSPARQASEQSAHRALGAAAQLCTELGRLTDLEELKTLLERVADAMDASGLMLWIGSTNGTEIRLVLAHGYSPEMIVRISAIPSSADNAAAIAYRTGTLQIVPSRSASSKGAIAAPILSADGCAGVLSAEIRDGGEASASVQALAAIFAAQLGGILAPASVPGEQPSAGSAAV